MNKKLTTIMFAVLFLLIGKVDAATLTQYVGENYIQQTVKEGQQVRLRFINQANYTFTNWTVESGNVDIDTTNPTVSFTMPNSDVVIRGNYSEEVAAPQGTTLSSVATVGAYVTYVPSSTSYTVPTTVSGYTSNQTYNPSNTTSWRVFSNDGEKIEIISTDSIGNLYLYETTGYANAVQTLNDMSSAYVNSRYATSGRSLGYYDEKIVASDGTLEDDMIETQQANYKVINTSTYPLNHGVSGFPYKDYQYYPDKTILDTNSSMYQSSGFVWFASRRSFISGSGTNTAFGIMGISSSGSFSNYGYIEYSNTTAPNAYGYGVRPVVSLKSGIRVTGTGTEADPYVINESNPSQYTVTYNANGGYGEMNPQSVSQGSSIALTTNAYEHHGSYAFKGWATGATATTVTYTNGQTITPTADMTLYAVWEEVYTCSCDYCEEIVYSEGELCENCSWNSCSSCGGCYCQMEYYCYECCNCIDCCTCIKIRYYANDGTGRSTLNTCYEGSSITIAAADTFTRSGYYCIGWSIDATAITASYVEAQTISPTSDIILYAVWLQEGLLKDIATVGSYVTYWPSNTSYTVSSTVSGYTYDQTYNPSSYTRGWRVFSNDGTNVEIISSYSVGQLTLKGSAGYINAVQTLNDMSAAYVNSTYAINGRSLGYSEDGLTDVTNYKKINTTTYPLKYNVSGAFPYQDYQYKIDKAILNSYSTLYSLNNNTECIWLASRTFGAGNSANFFVRFMNNDSGDYDNANLYHIYSDGGYGPSDESYGVRPVITLKSGLVVRGGAGTSNSPYIITVE